MNFWFLIDNLRYIKKICGTEIKKFMRIIKIKNMKLSNNNKLLLKMKKK